MSYLIEFTEDSTLNKVTIKKGTRINVSKSIRDAKTKEGVAKDATEKSITKKDKG